MSTPASTPSVQLNTALHAQRLKEGKVRPSTRASAQAALERLRQEKSSPKSA